MGKVAGKIVVKVEGSFGSEERVFEALEGDYRSHRRAVREAIRFLDGKYNEARKRAFKRPSLIRKQEPKSAKPRSSSRRR